MRILLVFSKFQLLEEVEMQFPIITRDFEDNIVSITIPRPSNFHTHIRLDDIMKAVAPEIMRYFKYVLTMPNNGHGKGGIIRSISDALRIYHQLMDIRAKHGLFTLTKIFLTLYDTEDVTPAVIERIKCSHVVEAVKNYPGHGGTTNSGHGRPFDQDSEVARAFVEYKVRRLFHAEDVEDLYGRPLEHKDREAHCITHRLRKFRDKYHGLYCVEHASTREAIDFVAEDRSGQTVMTVTPQHLLFTNEDFEKYSWRNHLKCMPIVKSEEDRQALIAFVTSGDYRAFAGDDTAPHLSATKERSFDECSSGCYMPHAIALYTLVFMRENALDERFINFMCYNGPDWWGVPRPSDDDTITIRFAKEGEKDIPDPTPVPALNDVIIPLGWSKESDAFHPGFIAG